MKDFYFKAQRERGEGSRSTGWFHISIERKQHWRPGAAAVPVVTARLYGFPRLTDVIRRVPPTGTDQFTAINNRATVRTYSYNHTVKISATFSKSPGQLTRVSRLDVIFPQAQRASIQASSRWFCAWSFSWSPRDDIRCLIGFETDVLTPVWRIITRSNAGLSAAELANWTEQLYNLL